MTQIGESVSVALIAPDKEKCIFCGKEHQDEKEASPANWDRDMGKLKKEGRNITIDSGRLTYYPDQAKPPLINWDKDITKTGGYKAAAHHCIALREINGHKISGELKEAGYDPNGGNNCIWLPYSTLQFYRARACNKPLQKHRGGHTDAYFRTVRKHINNISDTIHQKFCVQEEQGSKEELLKFANIQENRIWNGVAMSVDTAYYLYSKSYIDPHAKFPMCKDEEHVAKSMHKELPTKFVSRLEEPDCESLAEQDPE